MKYRIVKRNETYRIRLKDFLLWHRVGHYWLKRFIENKYVTLNAAKKELAKYKKAKLARIEGEKVIEQGEF